MTLTQVLQMQDQLWASLSNPHAAMQELAGETLPVPHVVICPQESLEKGGGGSTEPGTSFTTLVWEVVETGGAGTEGLCLQLQLQFSMGVLWETARTGRP